jgi:hypothetical protein
MKLKRSVPAISIWVVFVLFEIVMVSSSCFYLGLFPNGDNLLLYSIIFSVLSILIMSVITFLLGRLCDHLDIYASKDKTFVRIIFSFMAVLLFIAGIVYRISLLQNSSGEVTGQLSLYDNAMIGGAGAMAETDLLSIAYVFILRLILFFTGNISSVPFFFQIACFTVFMIGSFFTVRVLLGKTAAIVYLAYVAFMPVFTPAFTGLELSTDSLFMAMFGIELLFVALFIRGGYLGKYRSPAWIIWYLFVGAIVGFMAYGDAGTIIMVIPFVLAIFFLKGRLFKEEIVWFLFFLLGSILSFAGMIIQERGFMMGDVALADWSAYFFHNMSVFSTFWTYTDYKLIYMITIIVMSGVIVGFWKNRRIQKISPWMLSMLFIFVTVPFMGATRMNTQVFVTVYYALILGCVASLITMPADEDVELEELTTAPEYYEYEPASETSEQNAELPSDEVKEIIPEPEEHHGMEVVVPETVPEPAGEPAPEAMPEEEVAEVVPEEPLPEPVPEITPKPVSEPVPAPEVLPEEEVVPAPASEPVPQRFVPEGMVLPEDDEDQDQTPRMKMPEYKPLNVEGRTEKLHINREPKAPIEPEVPAAPEATVVPEEPQTPETPRTPSIDEGFDVVFKPGDDFDLFK